MNGREPGGRVAGQPILNGAGRMIQTTASPERTRAWRAAPLSRTVFMPARQAVVLTAVAGAFVLALAGSANAQTIVGVVRDAGTRAPLVAVQLTAIDSTGAARASALTDSLGMFRLAGMGAGTFTIEAERLGAETTTTQAVVLNVNERLQVDIPLRPDAIELQQIVVRERRRLSGRLAEYYDRLERGGRTGFGHFITRDQLDRVPYLSSHLRMTPGVWVNGFGHQLSITMRGTFGRCRPAIFLDGLPITAEEIDIITPDQLEGVEIYRGMHVPVRYASRSNCGAILLWTRADAGRPFTWKRMLVGLGLAGLLLILAFD